MLHLVELSTWPQNQEREKELTRKMKNFSNVLWKAFKERQITTINSATYFNEVRLEVKQGT